MSICASGSSVAKPGVNTSVIVTPEYVKSLLPSGWTWLYDYLPYMKMLEIGSVSTFCAADPPGWSIPSATDLFNFITGGYLTQNDVVTQFLDNVTRTYLWYSLCQCSSGTTPSSPSAPTTPTGLPGVNPVGVVVPPTVTPCNSVIGGPTAALCSTCEPTVIPLFPVQLGGPTSPLPVGCTSVYVTGTVNPAGSAHGQVSFIFTWDSVAGEIGPRTVFNVNSGTTGTRIVAVPAGGAYGCRLWAGTNTGTSLTDTASGTFDMYCNGAQPGSLQSSCCPPDPIAQGLLNQILGLVTIIQRQAVPFAYVPGTVHSGLSGTGSISVSGILALAATMTSTPTVLGDRVGTPPRLFDAGWLTLGTSDGYEEPIFLASANQLVVPRSAGIVTTVGYSLHPGVVLTLTELKREP